jgi:hypothetical protein
MSEGLPRPIQRKVKLVWPISATDTQDLEVQFTLKTLHGFSRIDVQATIVCC